ncbi:MAG: phytoene desaturase family protein [Actinomycetes bacterium]
MPQTCDAVVIGAGPNGLVAANLLVDAGWDVVVLEATPQPGGAVRSAPDYPAPGFTGDLFSAFYPLAAASPVLATLDLGEHGLTWTHAPAVLAHVFDDGRAAVLSRDEDETAAAVDAFAPGDGDAWHRWARRWREIEEPTLGALLRPFPPVRDGVTIARRLGVNRGLRFARLAMLPVRRFVEEEFGGAGAQLLVAGNALHTDLAPEAAGSSVYGLLLAMLGQHHGFPVPQGGSGALTDALVARLRSRGVLVQCDSEVRRVLLGERGAEGVVLGDGTQVLARNAVLADVPAPALYRQLVGEEHLSARLRHDLDRFQWDNATVKVNWALDRPIPWKAEGASRAGTVHLGGGLDDLTRCSADLATRTVPGRPFVLLGQMTTTDPTRSPAGTESAWAYAHLPRGRVSAETVRAFATSIEEEVERQAPGFRDVVRARVVQSPLDLEHDDASLDGGALNGGTAAIHQQLVFRPTPGLGRPDTPFPGLFLAGASAHPGGGVHGACGANAARAALRRARIGRRLYDGSVGAAQRHLS